MSGTGQLTRQKILHLGFNQDASCLVGGLEGGFFTFNTEPFGHATRRSFDSGIGDVELLYRSNILALVGGGSCPQWPLNKVMLWDDSKRKCVGELSFHKEVKSVQMRKEIVVVVLEKRIFVYNFVDLQMMTSFETLNPKGLCAVSLEPKNRVLAFPSKEVGNICVEQLDSGGSTSKSKLVIPAHETEVVAIALNRTGTLVASASSRGTLIRVFCTSTGELRHELRRGADRAVIYCICFNSDATLLACSSDKCTVHVFPIYDGEADDGDLSEESGNAESSSAGNNSTVATSAQASSVGSAALQSLLSIAGQAPAAIKDRLEVYLPKYFTKNTKRSLVRFPVQDTVTICAFGTKPNTLLVAGMDGSFSNHAFDLESGAYERTFLGSVFASDS